MTRKRHRTTGTPRRGIRLTPPIAAAALAVTLAGCQEPVTGIFHHVAQQDPPIDRNLANDLTIGGVARWGDRYVIAAGKTWARAVGTADDPGSWAQLTPTYDGTSAEAGLLPLVRWRPSGDDPSLLAGARFVKDDSFALLQADEVETGSIAWSTVGARAVRDREVIGLFTPDADESVLLVLVADDRGAKRTYTLLSARRRAGGAPDFTVEMEDLPRPIAAVAADDDGAYWAVAGSDLYTGALGGLTKSTTAPAPSGSETFRGVLYAAALNRLIISGSAGTLWQSTDQGGTWASPPYMITADDQATVPLAGMAAVGTTVLIGTDGFGYYTAMFDATLTVERLPLTTEAIYKSSIRSFWIDPDVTGNSRRAFALTTGQGLWTATVTPGKLPDRWQSE